MQVFSKTPKLEENSGNRFSSFPASSLFGDNKAYLKRRSQRFEMRFCTLYPCHRQQSGLSRTSCNIVKQSASSCFSVPTAATRNYLPHYVRNNRGTLLERKEFVRKTQEPRVLLPYHVSPCSNRIRRQLADNYQYLGWRSIEKSLWFPTISEKLVKFYQISAISELFSRWMLKRVCRSIFISKYFDIYI